MSCMENKAKVEAYIILYFLKRQNKQSAASTLESAVRPYFGVRAPNRSEVASVLRISGFFEKKGNEHPARYRIKTGIYEKLCPHTELLLCQKNYPRDLIGKINELTNIY